MHESATAQLLHPGLYSKEKSFILNHFMIIYKQLNRVNKQQEVFIKNILFIQNPVKHLRWWVLWKNLYIKINIISSIRLSTPL